MIYIVETIDATPGNTEQLREELRKIVPLSRSEQGCISYDLFVDRNNPNRFLVTALFKDATAYEDHVNSPHIQAFCAQFENTLFSNVVEHLYSPLI